ncbi:hypothetical protein BJ878DRAFT_540857 [Calycina marina]|uniref:Rhodopsin domain-containing protein n=1 Tax=Calycina marina TaxID=1763456 RepID=A0A9P7Z588_9HELO|nr:hypothetical protein BJ878DRAFT_540857 [Calycina marina]
MPQHMMESRADTLRTLFVVLLSISYVFTSLRVYIQWQLSKTFGADDCFLLAALGSFSIYIAVGMLSIGHGIGALNIDNLDPDLAVGLRYWLLAEIHYIITCTLLRLTCVIQLRKLATKPRQSWVLAGLAAATVVYNTGFCLLVLFQCAPIQFSWKGWVEMAVGSNIDPQFMAQVSYGFTGMGTGVDWLLVVISPWFSWEGGELDMSRNAKMGLRVLLIIGFGAGAAGLVRIPTTSQLLTTDDFFYDCVPIAMACTLECGLGFVSLSASTFKHICPSFFEKPPKPSPASTLIPLELHEKRLSKDSAASTRGSSSGGSTGAQNPNDTVLRKVSNDKSKQVA